jgi:Flp pilus assembly protein TadD
LRPIPKIYFSPTNDATKDSDPIAAAELTKKSQAKPVIGAVKASIEFGEDAVRLDSANAQAWLVLGAAYQQRGDVKNAWRCYHACVDQGKAAGQEKARAE